MAQPGAENFDTRRVYVSFNRLDRRRAYAVTQAWADGQGPTTDAVREAPFKRPTPLLQPPGLFFTADANNIGLSADEYTCMALGYRRAQFIGADLFALLHPGETEVNPDALDAHNQATTTPGKHFSYGGGHVTHADGHNMECVTVDMVWNGTAMTVRISLTEAEIDRVRTLFPHQFADPSEKEQFAGWMDARDRRKIQLLEAEVAQLKAAKKPADEPKMRKWGDADELRELIRNIHIIAGETAFEISIPTYCDRLQVMTGRHISDNLLRNRFLRFGWGELHSALREMAVEDTADQQLWSVKVKHITTDLN
jgi:hypothetical protein